MICWSCEKNAGDRPECVACGAVQPPDPKTDHFQVLGAPRTFEQNLGALERRYKDLTKTFHPDRFVRADPRARRASLARSVQLNDAWRTLRDPVRRAEYLLGLNGIELREEGAQKRSVSPEILMEVMELREGLAEARAAGEEAVVQRLATDVRGRRDGAMTAVAEALAGGGLEDAARALVLVRYYDRFLDEVRAHEDAETVEGPRAG
jgi:molecular chaperone HscB